MPAPVADFRWDELKLRAVAVCLPPDSNGDVGPNHYVQRQSTAPSRSLTRTGNPLNGVNGTTFNSFFADAGTGYPLFGLSQNKGDPFVLYDHLADRWVVSGLCFPRRHFQVLDRSTNVSVYPRPATLSAEVVGSSMRSSMIRPTPPGSVITRNWRCGISGGNPAQNAYYLTVNLFNGTTLGFPGVRVFALDRASMLTGGAANAIAFNIAPAGLGDSYSLVPAGFRSGAAPPAGRDEFLISVDSPGYRRRDFDSGAWLEISRRFWHAG